MSNNPEAQGPLVELCRVTKTYTDGLVPFTALKGIDLVVERGEFLSIVGKSGSGKSTLLNVLTGIDRPTSGEVRIGQAEVHTLTEEQIALWRGRTVGVIFQFFQLLPTLTAAENVMLPMDYARTLGPRERTERALRLLDRVGLSDCVHHLPAELSGGQQQRVAIARALANDPPLLAADEPTGNLDSRTATSILSLFEDLVGQGKTIMMVTHDTDLARRTQRTVKLQDGEIVEEHRNG
jgi:putative ABC transport system ATP-binding protein